MNTHTIRNKNKPTPILTLSKKFFEEVKKSSPNAFSLVFAKFVSVFKRLTGKEIFLDHDQQTELLNLWGADEKGVWKSKFSDVNYDLWLIETTFARGFMSSPESDMEKLLKNANLFFSILEKEL